jgi:hypothetical protein
MNLRAFYVWLMIIAAECVNGAVREMFLQVRFGDRVTHQIGVAVGSWLVFIITLATIRWMRVNRTSALLAVGAVWVFLTFTLETVLSRLLVDRSFDRVMADYDPNRGGLMLLGLAVLAISPLVAARLRGVEAIAPQLEIRRV